MLCSRHVRLVGSGRDAHSMQALCARSFRLGTWLAARAHVTVHASHAAAPGSAVLSPALESASVPSTSGRAHPVPSSAYVHIPFCKRKCWYCDFPVEAVGRNTGAAHVQRRVKDYVDLVCSEIRATQVMGSGPLQTVYFGGGTPSLVAPELMALILEQLDKQFGIASGAEISIEADPGTFDLSHIRAYMQLGVNRVSMGVQSFQQELLEACGRAHSLRDVHAAIDVLHASGVRSWTLDLISGLPHLTPDKWQASLDAAVAARPTHVSVYDLAVEEGTPFARWYEAGAKPLPQEEDAAAMYCAAVSTLTAAGFEHYEVSNYAQPGHRSAHNQVYWRGEAYYAFGLGAASYLAGRRFSRPKKYKEYVEWVEKLVAAGVSVPGLELPEESLEDRMLDTVMLRLRMADGLDLAQFATEFGDRAAHIVASALAARSHEGLVLLDRMPAQLAGPDASWGVHGHVQSAAAAGPSQGVGAQKVHGVQRGTVRHARLADPGGFLLSNDIISDVFAALSELPGKRT